MGQGLALRDMDVTSDVTYNNPFVMSPGPGADRETPSDGEVIQHRPRHETVRTGTPPVLKRFVSRVMTAAGTPS